MARIAIVTDSTACLPAELAGRYGIHVIPTKVIFGDQVFRDGIDLTPAEFYQMLEAAETLPTTTQPSVGEFLELYTRLGREAEAIVSIHIAEPLSGTIDSALAAKKEIPDLPIHIIDSRSTSMGLGFTTLAAARAAAEGKGLMEVVREAEDLVPRMNVIFVVNTLEYLQKGGRIGGAAALVGSLLKIRPILHLNDGRVGVLDRVRTKSKAVRRMLEIMGERVRGNPVHAAVIHANTPDEAEGLREVIASRFDCVELHTVELSPVIGTHVGPGTLGLAFYTEREPITVSLLAKSRGIKPQLRASQPLPA